MILLAGAYFVVYFHAFNSYTFAYIAKSSLCIKMINFFLFSFKMNVNQRVFYANEITEILLTLTITPVNCLHVDMTFT